VKRGLSDRVNFEVTLLKALREIGATSIDQLIRDIAAMRDSLPAEEEKKKS